MIDTPDSAPIAEPAPSEFVRVPREPTEAMLDAAMRTPVNLAMIDSARGRAHAEDRARYRAMLAAAPAEPASVSQKHTVAATDNNRLTDMAWDAEMIEQAREIAAYVSIRTGAFDGTIAVQGAAAALRAIPVDTDAYRRGVEDAAKVADENEEGNMATCACGSAIRSLIATPGEAK